MRPVVVCPEMSSPAQSLASVTHPISVSGPRIAGFWGLPGFCTTPAFRWQHSHANILHDRTSNNPTKNVMRLEHRKAYQCRFSKHSSSADLAELFAPDISTTKNYMVFLLKLTNIRLKCEVYPLQPHSASFLRTFDSWKPGPLLIRCKTGAVGNIISMSSTAH